MGVKIDINKTALQRKIRLQWENTLAPLAELILSDCNEYVRIDQGTLKESSATASDFAAGQLVWNTPYAKRVYYTGTPSHDVNPNASLMWAEKARAAYSKDWETAANRLFKGGG